MSKLIDIEHDLRPLLHKVVSPGRYVGGEFGSIRKEGKGLFRTAICFPDLYEIGMSNNAIRILYSRLNSYEKISCERVFAPAYDFEEELEKHGLPLYTLESGTPLCDLDLLGFSIGYELAATTILRVLQAGKIAVRSCDRGASDPLIIAGGPAVTNPAPFGPFFDGVFIGEAEERYGELTIQLSRAKERGASRGDLLDLLHHHPNIWHPGKSETVHRAVWQGFGAPTSSSPLVPNIKTVQDHGVVEIMRGCPNGCRFCHAGYFYRQKREKELSKILQEVDLLVHGAGYREITLSSLSSGDHSAIQQIITCLNRQYQGQHISFAFPSIKVNSFTLPLLEEISKVRKSGLTFAVEVAESAAQAGINKMVPIEQVVDILENAKRIGWKLAKFYFMIGLPVAGDDEEQAIIDYIREVERRVHLPLNVNVGTFIPKPHTPFQWGRQLGEEESDTRLRSIKSHFRKGKIKVSYHDPFISKLEGVISRGDERVADIIEEAFNRGAGFDAWEEHVRKDIWRDLFSSSSFDLEKEILGEKPLDGKLPWDGIDIGVGKGYLKQELKKSQEAELTSVCQQDCSHNCGICIDGVALQEEGDESIDTVSSKAIESEKYKQTESEVPQKKGSSLLLAFSKKGRAAYLSHINTMTIFERSIQRAGVQISFSQGFNPKPKINFANPIMLGVESLEEYAMFESPLQLSDQELERIPEALNKSLPEGYHIDRIYRMREHLQGEKKLSLMSAYDGSSYRIVCTGTGDPTELKSLYEKIDKALVSGGSVDLLKDSIEFFLPETGRKDGNLKYYIDAASYSIADFLSSFTIVRERMYARDKRVAGAERCEYPAVFGIRY